MPDRSNLVYRYDGTYQGFLCCVAQCFADKGLPQAVQRWEEPQATLFPLQGVDTDLDLAQRVERSIRAKASPEALRWVRDGFLSCEAQKELLLIRFVLLGYKYGAKVTGLTVQPDVCALWKTVRAVRSEAHCYLEFLRFSDLGGFLVGEIQPKNRVLPLLGRHFCQRCLGERFLLYDRTHKEALLGQEGRWCVIPLAEFTMALPDETEAKFRRLWKTFYDTVAIRERYNPKTRRTHMPMRYWGTMTEFQGEEFFTPAAQTPGAGAPEPGAPAGIPAPGTPSGSGRPGPGSGP